ncbi:MAG: S-adenosylmethionine:tRNA ribosyltransferase-isomerase [Actinomycetota bacterium]|nr:S-adenosylmethionine:tRNA ribosyltransferase-isomerase [Actinomycetota bacterium]
MTALASVPTTTFRSPRENTASQPPEAGGMQRDGIRLLVAAADRDIGFEHVRFRDIGRFLEAGDVLVVNTSATVAAEVDAMSSRHGPVVVHVAAPLDDGSFVVEIRTAPDAARPVLDAQIGDRLSIGPVSAALLDPYPRTLSSPTGPGNRLWRAQVSGDLDAVLSMHGRPIAYGYLQERYPLSDYQTVFGHHPGSAEMPSAGRPFTPALVSELVSAGVQFAPVLLHTGVSSQEAGEAPQPERFSVEASTADLVNAARRRGSRVVAVGTTATRAIESATGSDGQVRTNSGWTDLVISPERPARVVDGLVTGWHDPEASHLLLVESVAGTELTQQAYDAAVLHAYLWHEFGDSCLLLPRRDLAGARR